MHELAHIVVGRRGLYLDDLEEASEEQTEVEANRLAWEWLVDANALDKFTSATKPYFSRAKIVAFATTQNRHPGIIVGQAPYGGVISYKNFRRLSVKVSPYLEP